MSMKTLLKKPDSANEKTAKQDGLDNPYLNARRTWNEQVGSLVTAKQTWQVIGLLSLLIALAAIGGIIHIGSQSKFIPYIVQVDRHGQTLAVGAVQPTTNTDPRIVYAMIAEFITDARTVTPDIALKRKMIFRLYGKLSRNDPATQKMDEWLGSSEENNPFKRAEKELVSIDIRSLIAQSADTWQVDWTESVRDRTGALQSAPQAMRAIVTVYSVPTTAQTTDEQLRNNPLGLYVRDFSWSKVN